MSLNKLLVGMAAAGGISMANAAVDVSGITAAGTDVATVGAAVFLVYIGVKVYHWVRRAL